MRNPLERIRHSRFSIGLESNRLSKYHLDSNACHICLVGFLSSSPLLLTSRLCRYPDTFLYNTADNAGFLLPQDSQNVIVSHNGTVFWPLPLAQLRTRCRMTIKHFPFGKDQNMDEKVVRVTRRARERIFLR